MKIRRVAGFRSTSRVVRAIQNCSSTAQDPLWPWRLALIGAHLLSGSVFFILLK
jgi:hypothetical protein